MKNFRISMSLLLSLCIFQSAFTADAHERAIRVQDQQPEPAKAAASQQKAKKGSLMKSLAEFVKFKKRADKKFDAKLLDAIETLGVKDSIAATSSNVQALVAELRKEKNRDVASLQSTLDELNEKLKRQKPGNSTVLPVADPPPADPSSFDLEMLANELMPLITQKTAREETLKDKNEKLRQISRIRNADPAAQYTLEEPGNKPLAYRLRLKSKAAVFGFYDASGAAAWDATAFLNTAHALVYYALTLNEATGGFDSLRGWSSSPVVAQARQKGCRVYFTLLVQNKTGNSPFLYNTGAKEKCISSILSVLGQRHADGVNLSFKNMRGKDRAALLAFIQLLFQSLKKENPQYSLFVTIPRIDLAGAYDIEGLKNNSDLFFIDFATKTADTCGPLAPLYGGSQQTIDAAVSWYGARGIRPDKMVVILPYRGTRWLMDAQAANSLFVDYASFADIRRAGNAKEVYDKETSSVYIDTVTRKNATCRIWFDNEMTLGKKFDYIIKNGLAGAGLYFVNCDGFYNELNNEMVYKFTAVDTVYLKSPVPASPSKLSFPEKLERHLALFSYILQNPCASCFEEEGENAEERDRLKMYLKELEFDSLIRKNRQRGHGSLKNHLNKEQVAVTVKDEFNYANDELTRLLKYISLFFLVVSCGFIAAYIYGIKYFDSDWQYKKPIAGILVVLVSFFVFSLFTYCFTSDLIPLFGVSDSSFDGRGCSVDPNCTNVPFTTLLLVVFLGMLLGLAIYRYLVGPMLKRNHVP